jgi:predicted dehydrogenase
VPDGAGRDEFRVGLIGYGLAGAVFHAPLISATPGLRLTAIVTSNEARRAQAVRDHPEATLLSDADALWRMAPSLDLVIVASPNRTHVPLALAAVDAGVGVVVDKPLAATASEARRLIDAAGRRNVLLTVFQNRRWDGDFLTVRRLLAEGPLGTVARFESRFERWRPDVKPGWRMLPDPAEAGGLLFDLGSHLIDQALLLFGPVTHVYAELECRRDGMAVDDDAFVALRHASGVRSHLWISSVAAQHGPRFRLLGSRGAFTKSGLDVQEAALRAGADPGAQGWGDEPIERWGHLGAGDELRTVQTRPGDYPRFYRGMIETLRMGAPPPVDPEDAVATLSVIEAARTSAWTSQAVPIVPERDAGLWPGHG